MGILVGSYQASGVLNNQSAFIPSAGPNTEGLVTLDQVRNITKDVTAVDVSYDNSATALRATTVQEAIDILAGVPGQLQQFFINATTGNDSNPGTLALPLATLQRALSIMPMGWKGITEIVAAAGTYDLTVGNTAAIKVFPALAGGSYEATALHITGAYTNEVGTRTATATDATEMTLTDGSLAMAANAFVGAFVSITGGPNAGQRRMITANTATALLVNTALLPGTSVIGVDFIIEKPAVTFLYDNESWIGAGFYMKGVKFQTKVFGAGNNLALTNTFLVMDGCEVEMGGGDGWFVESDIFAQNFSSDPIVGSPLRTPSGLYVHGQPGFPGSINAVNPYAILQGYFVFNNMSIFLNGTSMQVTDVAAYNSAVSANEYSSVGLFSNNPNPPAPFASATPAGTFWDGVATFFDVSPLVAIASSAIQADNIEIRNATVGLVAAANSNLTLGKVTGSAGVVGSSSSYNSSTVIDWIRGSGPTSITGFSDLMCNGILTTYIQVRFVPPPWAAIAYVVGDRVTVQPFGPGAVNWYFECVTAGVAVAPPIAIFNPGGFFQDGTVVWKNLQGSFNFGLGDKPPGYVVGDSSLQQSFFAL